MPYFVAPYGLEATAFGETPGVTRSGVVCVGRIEPLKNQATLLFALRDLDVDVTLVGGSYDADYLKLCRRWATKRTTFADRLPDDELATLLQRTAVHVLPSWGDLPGFVSLEAAARGARVVAGARGSEREYLGPEVEYVDPLDPQAIQAAVNLALAAPPRVRGDALDERLRALRWDAYAATSIDAYARAIERRSSAQ
jgi:glycosyltransferase involved in cell wall biosynthesis